MIAVGILAIIIGSSLEIERRSRRFTRMAARHSRIATEHLRTLAVPGGDPPSLTDVTVAGQAPAPSLHRVKALVLYHRSLKVKYENAACYPWLPVPPDPPTPE